MLPSLFEESFFPTMLRNFSIFEEPTAIEPSNVALSEDENNVYVEAHVPGVKEEEIDVTIDKGMLWIKAEAKEEEEDKKRKYYHKASRSFSYRIALPSELDQSREPEAEYDKGVLKITFKKQQKETPKKITIRSGK